MKQKNANKHNSDKKDSKEQQIDEKGVEMKKKDKFGTRRKKARSRKSIEPREGEKETEKKRKRKGELR
jgi:hypothetical protein